MDFSYESPANAGSIEPADVAVTVSEACVIGPLGVGWGFEFDGGVVEVELTDEVPQPGTTEEAASANIP